MELKKVAIHEITKESGLIETKITLSEELIPNNENVKALISALLNSYKGDKVIYAVFDNSEGNYFPEKFYQYKEGNRNNDEFIEFTRGALTNLNSFIKSKTLARGGYYIFAEYSLNGIDYLSIFLIRDSEGKILKKTEHSYEVNTIEYLDTKNLAMACKINEKRIDDNQINYLSFTQLKQAEVAEYFLYWICIQQKESSSEYTKSLYYLINQIELPINDETNEEYPIEEFRNLVYKYITSNPNKTVNLSDLSKHFYSDPEKIISFAEENDIHIDTEFRYNKRLLRRFIKVEINRDGINLRISRGILNEKVRISEEDSNIVLIESKSFADALREELENN